MHVYGYTTIYVCGAREYVYGNTCIYVCTRQYMYRNIRESMCTGIRQYKYMGYENLDATTCVYEYVHDNIRIYVYDNIGIWVYDKICIWGTRICIRQHIYMSMYTTIYVYMYSTIYDTGIGRDMYTTICDMGIRQDMYMGYENMYSATYSYEYVHVNLRIYV